MQRKGGGPRAHRKWHTVKCVWKPAYLGKGDVTRVGGGTPNAFLLEQFKIIPPGGNNPFQSSSSGADLPKLWGDLVPITRFPCIK